MSDRASFSRHFYTLQPEFKFILVDALRLYLPEVWKNQDCGDFRPEMPTLWQYEDRGGVIFSLGRWIGTCWVNGPFSF